MSYRIENPFGNQRGGSLSTMTYVVILLVIASFGAGFYFDRWLHRPIEQPVAQLILGDDDDDEGTCPKRDHPPQTSEEWDTEYGCVRQTPSEDEGDVACEFTGSTCSVTL